LVGHPGQALQTQRYMARRKSACLRRPLQSPGGRGYPLHHSTSPGAELGVARAWVCRVFYRGKHMAYPCNMGTSGASCGAPTYEQTVSSATKSPQPMRTVQLNRIKHHSDAGHGENGRHHDRIDAQGRGCDAQTVPHSQPLWAYHKESKRAIAQQRGTHHASSPHDTRLRGARVLGEAANPRCPTAGTGGGGRGGAAGATRTAAVGPQQGVQRSYCTAAGYTPCYVPAWYPLARRARTQTEAADARCPTAAQWRRSRRHANSRCGPTTKSPKDLLRRSRTHTMLHARKVPQVAGTSNAA
jgi:hypothetical protein